MQKYKNSWYKSSWAILLLLILFFPVGLFLMWKYANWNKKVKWGVTGFFALMTFIGVVNPDSQSTPATTNKNNQAVQTQPTVEIKKLSYEVVKKEVNSTVENYKVLIPANEDAHGVALEIKKSCVKSCNISIFDDKIALELDIEYDAMMGDLNTPISAPQEWKEKNYVYVADHLVGMISFELEEYQEYPLRDWYYRELKGEN